MSTTNNHRLDRALDPANCTHPQEARQTHGWETEQWTECPCCGARWDSDGERVDADALAETINDSILELDFVTGIVDGPMPHHDVAFTTNVSFVDFNDHVHPIEQCGVAVKGVRWSYGNRGASLYCTYK